MANLTTKELSALEDQLGFEKMLCCKYREAAAAAGEAELKNCYEQGAARHKRNYETMLTYLK